MQEAWKNSKFFDQYLALSRKRYKIKPVTMEGEQETVPNHLNGTSFNDLERNIQWHEASRDLSTTAELFVGNPKVNWHCVNVHPTLTARLHISQKVGENDVTAISILDQYNYWVVLEIDQLSYVWPVTCDIYVGVDYNEQSAEHCSTWPNCIQWRNTHWTRLDKCQGSPGFRGPQAWS